MEKEDSQFTPQNRAIIKINNQIAGYLSKYLNDIINTDNEILEFAVDNYFENRNSLIRDYIKAKSCVGIIPREFNIENLLDSLYEEGMIPNPNNLPEPIRKKYKEFNNYKRALVFFYTDINGNVTSFKLRQFNQENISRNNKKIFTRSFPNIPLGAFLLSSIGESDYPIVYVVEGEFDALSPLSYFWDDESQESFENENYLKIVAAGGLDNIFFVAKKLIENEITPIIIPDFDTAGSELIERLINTISHNIKGQDAQERLLSSIHIVRKPPENIIGKDLDEIFSSEFGSKALFFKTIEPVSLSDILRKKIQQKEQAIFDIAKELPSNLQKNYLESKGVKIPF